MTMPPSAVIFPPVMAVSEAFRRFRVNLPGYFRLLLAVLGCLVLMTVLKIAFPVLALPPDKIGKLDVGSNAGLFVILVCFNLLVIVGSVNAFAVILRQQVKSIPITEKSALSMVIPGELFWKYFVVTFILGLVAIGGVAVISLISTPFFMMGRQIGSIVLGIFLTLFGLVTVPAGQLYFAHYLINDGEMPKLTLRQAWHVSKGNRRRFVGGMLLLALPVILLLPFMSYGITFVIQGLLSKELALAIAPGIGSMFSLLLINPLFTIYQSLFYDALIYQPWLASRAPQSSRERDSDNSMIVL